MDPQLLSYYEAIERASAQMLTAARAGNWDEVVKLEGACVLLISKLKHAALEPESRGGDPVPAAPPASGVRGGVHSASWADTQPDAVQAAKAKSRLMQRILVNDAEIRHLAEPWLQDIDETLSGRRSQVLH